MRPLQKRSIYYHQAKKEIENGQIAPFYLLYGEEVMLADNLLNLLKIRFLEKVEPELNFFTRYAGENGGDAVISLGTGMGLFSQKKLIILKNAQALKTKEIDRIIKFSQKQPPEICLVFQTMLTSIYQSRLKKLENYTTSVNLLPLRVGELNSFIQSEFKKWGKEPTPEAVQLLIFMVGTQLTELIGQINMICQYHADLKRIDAAEIEEITSIYATRDIYELAAGLGQRDLKKSIFCLHNLLAGGISPQQIISQLLRHFSILWSIKGYYRSGIRNNQTISRELRIYSKYFNEYAVQSRRWNSNSLKKVFSILCKADKESRDSGIPPEISLDILSRQIINC